MNTAGANTLALKLYAGLVAVFWVSVLLTWLGALPVVVPLVLFFIVGGLVMLALVAASCGLFGMR
jgi:hypothetical protein